MSFYIRMCFILLTIVLPLQAAERLSLTTLSPTKVIIDTSMTEIAGKEVALSSDNAYLAAIKLEDNTFFIQLYDVQSGKPINKLFNGKRGAKRISFLDKNRLLVLWMRPNVYGDPDRLMSLSIISIPDGKTLTEFKIEGSEKTDTGLILPSAAGDRVITYLEKLEVWDLSSGKRVYDLGFPFPDTPHNNSISGRRNMTLSADGMKLCVSEPSGKFNLYDLSDGKQIGNTQSPGKYQTVCISGNGKHLYVSGDSGVIRYPIGSVPDAPPPPPMQVISKEQILIPGTTQPVSVTMSRSSNPTTSTTRPRREYGRLFPFSESPDGKHIAGLYAQDLIILDITGEQPRLERKIPLNMDYDVDLRWSANSGYVTTATWGATQIFDISTGDLISGSAQHNAKIVAMDVADNGQEFVTADIRSKINRWTIPDFQVVNSHPEGEFKSGVGFFRLSNFPEDGLQYAPGDRELVLTGMNLTRLHLTDFTPQSPQRRMSGPVLNPTYSDDFNLVGSLFRDDPNTIAITNSNLPEQSKMLHVSAPVKSIALDRSGGKIAVLSGEKLELFDIDRDKTIAAFEVPKGFNTLNPPQLKVLENQFLFAWTQSGLVAWQIPERESIDVIKPRWTIDHAIIGPIFKLSVSPKCGLIYILTNKSMCLIDVPSGEVVAALDLVDQQPRLGKPIPLSSMYLLASSFRRLSVYDIQQLISSSQKDQDYSSLSGARLMELTEGPSASAYGALVELRRRKELMPRIQELLKDTRTTIGQTIRAKQLIAGLSSEEASVREKAHRELERMGTQAASAIKQAIPISSGEAADRLSSLMRLIGDKSLPSIDGPEGQIVRAREVLSWQNDVASIELVTQIDKLLAGDELSTTQPAK